MLGSLAMRRRAMTSERWTAEKASQVLAEWRRSGLSMSAFAARRGLKAQRLSWWKKRLADWNEGDASSSGPALVPALVGGDEMGVVPEAVVRLPAGVVVEVMSAAAVSPQWLSALAVDLARAK